MHKLNSKTPHMPTRGEMLSEARIVYKMLWPMIVANVLIMASNLVTTEWTGRMGQMELAGAALGNMTVSISVSVAIGLISAVDTLAAQAFGARNGKRVGIVMQRGLFICFLYGVPLVGLWFFLEPIFVALHQPPNVSHLASVYIRCVAFGIIPCFFQQAIAHALMATRRPLPAFVMMTSSSMTTAITSWIYTDVIGLGYLGPPLSLAAGWVLGLPALIAFAHLSGAFKDIWFGFSRDCFTELPHFLGLALPGILMTCSDWIAFEICALIAGALGPAELATCSLLYQTVSLVFMIPMSLGMVVSARVGNGLGSKNARQARAAICVCCISAAAFAAIYLTVLGCVKQWWGLVFTNQLDIVDSVADCIPVICIMEAMDCFQAIEAGIMRGAGMQKWGAAVNFICFYAVALPLAALAAFKLHWGVKGIYMAMTIGVAIQVIVFTLRLGLLDWDKLAAEVALREAKRLHQSSPSSVVVSEATPINVGKDSSIEPA